MKASLTILLMAMLPMSPAAGSYMYTPIPSARSAGEESAEFAIRLFDDFHDSISKEFGPASAIEISVSLNREDLLYTYVITYPGEFSDLQVESLRRIVRDHRRLIDTILSVVEADQKKLEELRKKGDEIQNESRENLMKDLVEAFGARVKATPIAYWHVILKKKEA